MIINKTDTDKEVYIIAEIGNNHEGDFKTALKMLKEAAACGVNAVKFQTFKTELFVSRDNEERFNRLKSFELSYQEFLELSQAAAAEGVDFISTPLDLESAEFLSGIVKAVKIASSDNNFYELLDRVSAYDLPIILSGGIMDISQLQHSFNFIKKSREKYNISADTAILHCVCSYPVTLENANLSAIRDLINNFKNNIGYSDHTIGINAVSASVALGARIVEKHFTLDHHFSSFRDHQLSATPEEMRTLVKNVRELELMLGNGQKKPMQCELEIEPLVRRSLRAAVDIEAGDLICQKNTKWVRPGNGLKSDESFKVMGKIAARKIRKDDLINLTDIK